LESAALSSARRTDHQHFLLSSGALTTIAAFALATLFVVGRYNAGFGKSTICRVAIPLSSIFLSIGGGGILYFSYSLYKIKRASQGALRPDQQIVKKVRPPLTPSIRRNEEVVVPKEGTAPLEKTPLIIQIEQEIAESEKRYNLTLQAYRQGTVPLSELDKERTTLDTLRENLAAAECMALKYNELLDQFPPLLRPILHEAGLLYDIITIHLVRLLKAVPANANEPLNNNLDALQDVLIGIKKIALVKLHEAYSSEVAQYNIEEIDSYLKKYDQIRLKSAEKQFTKAEQRYASLPEEIRAQSKTDYEALIEKKQRVDLGLAESDRLYKQHLREYKKKRLSKEDLLREQVAVSRWSKESTQIRLALDINEYAMFIKAETALKTYKERSQMRSLMERTPESLLGYLPLTIPGLHLLEYPFSILQEPLPSYLTNSAHAKNILLVLADKLDEFLAQPLDLANFIPQLESYPRISKILTGLATSKAAEVLGFFIISRLEDTLENAKTDVHTTIDSVSAIILNDRGFQLQYSTPETRAFISQTQSLLKEIASSYIDMLKSKHGLYSQVRRDFIKEHLLSAIRALPEYLRGLADAEDGPLTSKSMQDAVSQSPIANLVLELEGSQEPLPPAPEADAAAEEAV
jgi:hypothetical protein